MRRVLAVGRDRIPAPAIPGVGGEECGRTSKVGGFSLGCPNGPRTEPSRGPPRKRTHRGAWLRCGRDRVPGSRKKKQGASPASMSGRQHCQAKQPRGLPLPCSPSRGGREPQEGWPRSTEVLTPLLRTPGIAGPPRFDAPRRLRSPAEALNSRSAHQRPQGGAGEASTRESLRFAQGDGHPRCAHSQVTTYSLRCKSVYLKDFFFNAKSKQNHHSEQPLIQIGTLGP